MSISIENDKQNDYYISQFCADFSQPVVNIKKLSESLMSIGIKFHLLKRQIEQSSGDAVTTNGCSSPTCLNPLRGGDVGLWMILNWHAASK